MGIKSLLAKPLASITHQRIVSDSKNAIDHQKTILADLLKVAPHTLFGKDFHLDNVYDYASYKDAVPINGYEGFTKYIELIKEGKPNILWKGKPLYLAKTSGTTSGVKYIPISKNSIGNHINTARNALLNYMSISGNSSFADGNMIFLSGSPELERVGGIPTGRLSGIVNHHVPQYLRSNQMPKFETNCIEDWETKLHAIVEETFQSNMTLVSGIPPWVQMYFDWLLERSGKKNIKEVFPNLQVFVYGGVNFAPYQKKLFDTIGHQIDSIETFPASEGFFAFQDTIDNQGLLLNTNSGIFYEFVPSDEIFNENPTRLTLEDVKLDTNYALIISSNAGLWSYSIGDTVKFVSLDPYRLIVTGRIKHFISAFGEHVIGEEVEKALANTLQKYQEAKVTEFTVAPMVVNNDGLPYHEWYIEFENEPDSLTAFSFELDNQLRKLNVYYDDLIKGGILQPLIIRSLRKNTFIDYMKSIGKLGGQNKTPRLSNDRAIADELNHFYL